LAEFGGVLEVGEGVESVDFSGGVGGENLVIFGDFSASEDDDVGVLTGEVWNTAVEAWVVGEDCRGGGENRGNFCTKGVDAVVGLFSCDFSWEILRKNFAVESLRDFEVDVRTAVFFPEKPVKIDGEGGGIGVKFGGDAGFSEFFEIFSGKFWIEGVDDDFFWADFFQKFGAGSGFFAGEVVAGFECDVNFTS